MRLLVANASGLARFNGLLTNFGKEFVEVGKIERLEQFERDFDG